MRSTNSRNRGSCSASGNPLGTGLGRRPASSTSSSTSKRGSADRRFAQPGWRPDRSGECSPDQRRAHTLRYRRSRMIARALLLLLLLAGAGGLFLRRLRFLWQLNALGRPVARTDDLSVRVAREGTHVLAQRKLFQRFVPGLMHALIFWGFL